MILLAVAALLLFPAAALSVALAIALPIDMAVAVAVPAAVDIYMFAPSTPMYPAHSKCRRCASMCLS